MDTVDHSVPALPHTPDVTYSFAGFRLEADGTLRRGRSVVHLPPKELLALRLLLAHAGQVVSPTQLKQALWGNVHVTADSIPKCLSSLRAHLEPDDCIQTVYKRGYRFSAETHRLEQPERSELLRLAIVPFSTGYGVAEHLGPAIAEDTIASLSNALSPTVSILARDSVFTLAGRGLTAAQLGAALQADLVLTGTLTSVFRHFRLRAEMIKVADGTQLWVEDLLVDQELISGLQAEVVQRLTVRLNAAPGLFISAAAVEPEIEMHPQRKEAYEFYLRGHHEWQTLQRHRMQDGLQHLLRATELDPSLIPAKVDLVNLCVTQAFYGFMSPIIAAENARKAAYSIEGLSPQAELALPALGWIAFHVDHDLPTATRTFEACAGLPHDPWTTRLRSMFALSRWRFAAAVDLLRSAIRIDPFAPWLHSRLAWALHLEGRAAESLDCVKQAIARFPEHEGVALYASILLAYNGETARAVQMAEGLAHRTPYFDLATAVHAYALACDGQPAEARAILERLQWLGRERFVLRSFTPAVYMALGEPESAVAELHAAEQSRCPWFFQMLVDPRLAPLAGHPEFERMRGILPRMEAEASSFQNGSPAPSFF